jgi:hypothetical protein
MPAKTYASECWIEARRLRGCVAFGDQLVELLAAHSETFVPAEAQFTAVDYAYPCSNGGRVACPR